MLNLLFIVLFMTTTATTEKQKLVNPQVAIKVEQPVFDRNSMGYTDRPINQRTQVNNVYLDSADFGWDLNMTTMTQSYIASFTLWTTVWKYPWKTENTPWTIYIPTWGTYSILWDMFISTAPWIWRIRLAIEINWWADIKVISTNVEHKTNTPIILNYNFIKWDFIRIYVDNDSSDSVELNISLNITKIS